MAHTKISRLVLISACAALLGAPLHAGTATWYFVDTTLQGTEPVDGTATVTGYVSVDASTNFDFPVSITLTGPFGQLVDPGAQLQFDEGSGGYTGEYVQFILSQALATTSLTTVPLTEFSFTSAFTGSTLIDTYSLISGALTDVAPAPEPGTAPEMLLGALGLIGAAVWLRSAKPGHRLS